MTENMDQPLVMDQATAEAREIALAVLQPSARDLEHGLQLHLDSLVFDSYGFAPTAGADNGRLEAAAAAGASSVELRGLREEMIMTGMLTDPDERQGYARAFAAAGVDCLFQNAGEESNSVETLLLRLGRFTHNADMMPEVLRRAATPDDILAARRAGRHCLYLTTNGVPLPAGFDNAEEGLALIRTFFQLGVRMMHLTYNRRNLLGDGCAEAANGGLSEFGRAAVAEMNRAGVLVDISHSGVRTGLEAARCSGRPVIISHAVCGALSDHMRAKPDELLRAVAETGGTMGICCIPGFLQGSGDINALLDHIDHAVSVVGADHVTIGTDAGVRCRGDQPEATRPAVNFGRRIFPSLWPPNDPVFSPQWNTPERVKSMRWTNWPLFTVGLVQRGYSDDDIRKIIGGNMMRVVRAAHDSFA